MTPQRVVVGGARLAGAQTALQLRGPGRHVDPALSADAAVHLATVA